jgi:predicted ATPase
LFQLLVDSLHCGPERADPLARLIHEKTRRNPFFAIQFISALADEGPLTTASSMTPSLVATRKLNH